MNLIKLIECLCMNNNIVLHISKDFIRYEKTFINSVSCYNYIKENNLDILKVRNIDIFSSAGYNAFIIDCIE